MPAAGGRRCAVDGRAAACHPDRETDPHPHVLHVRTRSREALQRAHPATLGFGHHARAALSRSDDVFFNGVAGSFRRPRVRAEARPVGRVAALWRYPVKSMAPEALERADVGWHGIAGDRRWGFPRGDPDHDGFPWLTIRERPALARY